MGNRTAPPVYTKETDDIDEISAKQAVSAVLRFLTRMGVIRYNSHSGYIANVILEDELTSVHSDEAGVFHRFKGPGEEVHRGDVIAEVLDPYEGDVISQIIAPTEGIIFFSHKKPLITQRDIVCKIIRRLHE